MTTKKRLAPAPRQTWSLAQHQDKHAPMPALCFAHMLRAAPRPGCISRRAGPLEFPNIVACCLRGARASSGAGCCPGYSHLACCKAGARESAATNGLHQIGDMLAPPHGITKHRRLHLFNRVKPTRETTWKHRQKKASSIITKFGKRRQKPENLAARTVPMSRKSKNSCRFKKKKKKKKKANITVGA